MRRRNSPGDINVWPAFTDVLGSVLVVLVFLITIFVINETLIGHEVASKKTAIEQLKGITDYLDSLLGEANQEKDTLRAEVRRLYRRLELQESQLSQVRQELGRAQDERGQLSDELTASRTRVADLDRELNTARDSAADLERRLMQREADYSTLETAHEAKRAELGHVRDEAALLTARVERLAAELRRLNSALAAREQGLANAQARIGELESEVGDKEKALTSRARTIATQRDRIAEMDRLIKSRLVERVEELERYASEFFGRLRKVFAGNPDIKVVGDRFVFQSEVLFPSGGATLSSAGRKDLEQFVEVYRQVETQIPKDLPVIIEVQGHTDRVPINTPRFASNWELSTARALNVIDYLISRGIPPSVWRPSAWGSITRSTPASVPKPCDAIGASN